MSIAKRAIDFPLLSRFRTALKGNIAFANLLTLVFLLLGLVGILNHEMWRDELQAWIISRDSTSIINLFKNLRYEGHPGLWHLCLYFLAKLTRNPVAMQLFSLALSAISTYLFARFSPFTRLQKVLFAFGYFSFYEYTIISRSYGLGVFLTFAFCAVLSSRYRKNQLLLSIIIVLLANTSLYGLAIALSFQAFLLLEKRSDHATPSSKRLKLIGLLIVSLGVGIALLQVLPPDDSGIPADFTNSNQVLDQTANQTVRKLKEVTSAVWKSYIPIPNIFIYEFWNTNIADAFSVTLLKIAKTLISVSLLLFSVEIFAQKISVCIPYLLGIVGIFALNFFNFNVATRHYGHLFILFIAHLWILDTHNRFALNTRLSEAKPKHSNRVRGTVYSAIFTSILVIQLIAGAYSFSRDLLHPFSSSEEAARFIQRHQMTSTLMVGSKDYVASTLSGLLGKKIYYLESAELGSFITWNNNRRNVKPEAIFKRANMLLQSNTELLLILNQALNYREPSLITEHLASFNRSIAGENIHLYLIRKQPCKNCATSQAKPTSIAIS